MTARLNTVSDHVPLPRRMPGKAVPVREWPLLPTEGAVVVVCPVCSARVKVRTVGRAWAVGKTHNDNYHTGFNRASAQ